MIRKIISLISIFSIIFAIISPVFVVNAVNTNELSSPWTREKAEHLARKALIGATNDKINELYLAGNADNAVNILFPSINGPDRTNYESTLSSISSDVDFNPENTNDMYEYYMVKKLLDPYEAKMKFFQVIEDTFSVFRTSSKDITFTDIENTHELLYSHTLGNYKELVKRNLYNDGNVGDYSLGQFLDLFNQKNPKNPNENYGREILQLFLMLEYIPTESEDKLDERNYTEDDVAAISKILIGFESDENTHEVSFNTDVNTNLTIEFLEGPLKSGDSYPFYDSGSGIIDIQVLKNSINGNNGLPDNTIDYIFSKREYSIAMFLADKLYRFYIAENPIKSDLDIIANKIIENNFDLFPSIKWLLVQDMMYSDKSMNEVIYKNPVELSIGTAKILGMDESNLRSSTLYNLDWKPYYPPNVFGRNGFDDNSAFFTSYIANKWVSESSNFSRYVDTNLFIEKEILLTNFNGTGSIFDNYSYYNDKENLEIITSSGNTLTGTINLRNIVLIDANNQIINISNGTVNFENLSIDTSEGIISFNSGQLNYSNNSIILNSGNLDNNGVVTNVKNGYFEIDGVYTIIDQMTPDYIISSLENKLYMGRKLSTEVRNKLLNFLQFDKDGNNVNFNLKDSTFDNYYTKGLIHLMLIQPEYVLQSGYDKVNISDGSINPFFTNDSKLVLIKAGGGLDYLHGIIPKDEYSEYLDNRGTGAITGTGLLSLNDDYYINSSLESFKSVYDSGNLMLINRVGTPDHSRGHDSASRKFTSLNNLYDLYDDGIVGHFIKNEDSSKSVVLGTYKPFIFRGGKYLNIGSNALYGISDSTNNDFRNYKIGVIKDIYNNREYPGTTSNIFKNSAIINDVASNSKNNGGRSGAGGNMEQNFTFLESLLDSNMANITRMGADGGYDTHGKQKDNLNNNFKKVADRTVSFFNKVKDKQDITIVLYSEFGRTVKINNSLGTDHGKAGGMIILSNNQNLLSSLDKKVYGNTSFVNAKGNWLGVGIDYRSVYSVLFKSLYGKDISNEVGGIYDIDDYIDSTGPKIDLFRIEAKEASNGSSRSSFNLIAKIDDKNFLPSQASYLRLEYGTDKSNMKEESAYVIDRYMTKKKDKINLYINNLNEGTKYYYKVTLYDNQYNTSIIEGEFDVPFIKGTTDDSLFLNSSTRLRKFNNININGDLDISSQTSSGIVLSSQGDTFYNGKNNLYLKAGTSTFITNLLTSTGTIWNGTFTLPELIDKNIFIGEDAEYLNDKLTNFHIEKLVKVGADSLGVGMKLNKNVEINVSDVDNSKNYIILRTNDGISWIKVNNPEIKKSGNDLIFETDHFSYFAIVESDSNGNPLVVNTGLDIDNNNITSEVVYDTGGSGWGGGMSKDDCEFGDYTESYYDRECGAPIDDELSKEGIENTYNYILEQELSEIDIEEEKISKIYDETIENNVNKVNINKEELIKLLSDKLYSKTIDGGYSITQIKGSKLNNKFINIANLILKKEFSKKDTNNLINSLNDFILYNGISNLEGIEKEIKINAKSLLKDTINNLKEIYKVAKYNKKINKLKVFNYLKQSAIRNKETKEIKEVKNTNNDYDTSNKYLYKIKSNIIDLRSDPYWKSINARLYKGDIVEQITLLHEKQFFKVRIIKSKDGYEGKEGYIFLKHLEK